MKIRTDYVSNSSSSSFVIVGKVFSDVHQIMNKLMKDKGRLLEELKKECGSEYDYESIEDFIAENSLYEVLYRVFENTGLDFQIAGLADEVLVGYDMKSGDHKMKDDETLKEYKDKVVAALNEKGIEAKYNEVGIVTGGSDAGGTTFFNNCG